MRVPVPDYGNTGMDTAHEGNPVCWAEIAQANRHLVPRARGYGLKHSDRYWNRIEGSAFANRILSKVIPCDKADMHKAISSVTIG